MTKKIILLISIFTMTQNFAQNSLNDYKYVVVPNKYDFFKEADKHQLNSLTEFLFNKYGFNAYLENEKLPIDASQNRCLVLRANVLEDKKMFKTKLTVQLKNCNNQIVYTSPIGESRKKEFKAAYNEALRNAFHNFSALNYEYLENEEAFPVIQSQASTEISKVEIEQLKQEIKELKQEKKIKKEPIITEIIKQENNLEIENEVRVDKNQLYAQFIDKGFQLVDKTPKVIYTIFSTGERDVFIVKGRDAVIHKVNGAWAISEFKNDMLEVKVLKIKF